MTTEDQITVIEAYLEGVCRHRRWGLSMYRKRVFFTGFTSEWVADGATVDVYFADVKTLSGAFQVKVKYDAIEAKNKLEIHTSPRIAITSLKTDYMQAAQDYNDVQEAIDYWNASER